MQMDDPVSTFEHGVPFISGAMVRCGGPSSWGRPRALLQAVPSGTRKRKRPEDEDEDDRARPRARARWGDG